MERYDYMKAMKEDVKTWINDNGLPEHTDRDDLEEQLNEELWTCDSVTGNGSGSYTFSRYQADEYICHNMDLFRDAMEEFGETFESWNGEAEYADVTIRCYLLSQAIAEVLGDLE